MRKNRKIDGHREEQRVEDEEVEAGSPKHILPVYFLILTGSYFYLKSGTYRFPSYECNLDIN